ncbi:MAG TPA: type IV pilin protein, partial [Burkholderiaceae bacterium]|nr:type IV pilin protein [Burkholderiaceae bacterium]
YITRSKRSAAKAVLLDAANRLERNYTTHGCYNKTTAAKCQSQAAGDAYSVDAAAPAEGKASYRITAASLDSQSFTLVATPCGMTGASCSAGSDPFTDADCLKLTLTSTGDKGLRNAADTDSNDMEKVARCWQR